MLSKLTGVTIILALAALAACVPSPTATPPRQTPFPTLPLTPETGTPVAPTTAEAPGTAAPGAATSPVNPPSDTTAQPTNAPGTAPAPPPAALLTDTLPPIVEIAVQDTGSPVSQGKTVPLNVLAADNNLLVRLDLYDNNVLVAQAPALTPAAIYSNQFAWQAAAPGKHVLRAVAYDAAGNTSVPAQIEINVIPNNLAPAVLITSPGGTSNAELGAPMLIQGVATDDVAVTRMDLVVDNQLVTSVRPTDPKGVTPYAVSFAWTPVTTGTHNFVLRAFDNQGQSDDSLRYTVHVFDNQAPVVTAAAEHATIPTGDALLVDALALAKNGVPRLELYIDEQLADFANSANPARQTSLSATLTSGNLNAGTHTYFVRAYDLSGQTSDTERVAFTVVNGDATIYRDTPRPPQTNTPLPPTPTATPAVVMPDAPTVQLQLLGDTPRVALPDAAKIQIRAHGSAELDTVQLWQRYPGETYAQLLTEENVKGSTDKTVEFDWSAPRAGVVELFARVTDNTGQSGESAVLHFEIQPPGAPSAAPGVVNFAQTWMAESPAARYEVTFDPLRNALRGLFVERRADGTILTGRVVSGIGNDKNASFAVDFGSAANPPHTLVFVCTVTPRPPALTCNYTNENGDRGSGIFTPLAQP